MIRRRASRTSRWAAVAAALFMVGAVVGCSPMDPDGQGDGSESWTEETIAGMTVHLYVPQAEPRLTSGRALMVSLHGCTQPATELVEHGNWTSTADDYGMVVAVPAVPDGGVVLGCWDYYGTDHSRTEPARHDDNLLELANELGGRSSLGIDADQVYLTGVSAGGGQTAVMGCLAPDVFAGIGLVGAPAVGTSASQTNSVAVTQSTATNTCLGFAGPSAGAFDTQVTSVIYDQEDSVVAPGYAILNAEVMARLYGAETSSEFSLDGVAGNNTRGSGTFFSDADGPRVSLIQNSGMGHNWPAGAGAGGHYVTADSIDYPAYVTEFFFDHNRRVR